MSPHRQPECRLSRCRQHKSRQTKKALADQSRREPHSTSNHRGSRTAHHPKNRIDPFEQCPSRALLGSQAPTRGAAGCRVTENAGRAECSDAQTRLLKKSEAGLPHANLSGGSCMHALQIREKDGHKTPSNEYSLGIRFYAHPTSVGATFKQILRATFDQFIGL
jgi:hypothetical protein